MPWENKEDVCDCGHLFSAHLPNGSCCAINENEGGICKCTKFHKSREAPDAAVKRIKADEDKIKGRIAGIDFTEKEGIV